MAQDRYDYEYRGREQEWSDDGGRVTATDKNRGKRRTRDTLIPLTMGNWRQLMVVTQRSNPYLSWLGYYSYLLRQEHWKLAFGINCGISGTAIIIIIIHAKWLTKWFVRSCCEAISYWVICRWGGGGGPIYITIGLGLRDERFYSLALAWLGFTLTVGSFPTLPLSICTPRSVRGEVDHQCAVGPKSHQRRVH